MSTIAVALTVTTMKRTSIFVMPNAVSLAAWFVFLPAAIGAGVLAGFGLGTAAVALLGAFMLSLGVLAYDFWASSVVNGQPGASGFIARLATFGVFLSVLALAATVVIH